MVMTGGLGVGLVFPFRQGIPTRDLAPGDGFECFLRIHTYLYEDKELFFPMQMLISILKELRVH